MVGTRSTIARNAKYTNSVMALGYQPGKIEKYLPDMIAQFKRSTAIAVFDENTTKLILAEAGITTILNPFYIAFAKQISRLRLKFSGTQLINETDVILIVWAGRGLDRDTLEKIRNSVYTIAAPAP